MSSISLTSASPQGIIKFNSFLEYEITWSWSGIGKGSLRNNLKLSLRLGWILTDRSSLDEEMSRVFKTVRIIQAGRGNKHMRCVWYTVKSPVKIVQFESREYNTGKIKEFTKQMYTLPTPTYYHSVNSQYSFPFPFLSNFFSTQPESSLKFPL